MSKQIKALIESLNEMTPSTEKKSTHDGILNALKKMAAKPARVSENTLSSHIVTILTLMPEYINHPESESLKQLCLNLKTTELELSPQVKQHFFSAPSQTAKHEIRKPKARR